MAYDAPDYTVVLWDASGKPYWKTASGKKTYIPPITAMQMSDDPKALAWAKSQGFSIGTKADGTLDVKTNAPGSSLLKNRGVWNSETGQYDQGINWGNIAAIGIGGAIAAPFVVGALAGGAGAAPVAGGTAGATGGAGGVGTLSGIAPTLEGIAAGPGAISVPAAAAGGAVLPSTTAGVSALGTLPAVSASGAVPAALAAGTTGAAAAAPAYGPLAGGYGAATTEASIPPALAATGATAGGVGSTLSSLLPKAIPAAANIIGNQIQKGAINNAVNAQVGSQEKALEAERLGGERAIGILAPWANVGGAAANRLGELLHLQPPPAVPGQMPVTPAQQSSANSFVPNAVRNSPTASQVSQAPGPYANWPIYQAPDGSKRRVDPSQAQAAEAAGATRVG